MRRLKYKFEMDVTAEDEDQLRLAHDQLALVADYISMLPPQVLGMLPTAAVTGRARTAVSGVGWMCVIKIEEKE